MPEFNLSLLPLRFSHLRTLGNKSPRHLQAVEAEATASMETGTAFHSLVLGGKRVIPYEDGPRRGKAWDAFEAANADALILTPAAFTKVGAMAAAVKAHPLAVAALEGVRETTIAWDCAGVACRSTPDVRGKPSKVRSHITELKQARTADPRWFVRDALKMAYHGQTSFYEEAIRTAFPDDYPASCEIDHIFVACEPEPPYVVQVYRVTDRAKEAARKLWWGWFERFKSCLENNHWPAYSERIEEIDMPEDVPGLTFAEDDEDAAEPTLEQIAA